MSERMNAAPETNERGNTIDRAFFDRDRYHYDFKACTPADGWEQFDTDQDAWYFGVWVNMSRRVIVTYAEGDEITVTCPTDESFRAELGSMADFYGTQPPFATTLDIEAGTVTKHIAARPTGETA